MVWFVLFALPRLVSVDLLLLAQVLISCKYWFALGFNKSAQLLVLEFIRVLGKLKKSSDQRLLTIYTYIILKDCLIWVDYEHIEVLFNPSKISRDRKVENTILRLHPLHTKFQQLWIGPFQIAEKIGPSTYKLWDLQGWEENLPVNGLVLKPYFS